DIEGLGERTAEQLVTAELIQDPADLYALTAEELLKLEGFAEKRAANLLTAIAAAKQRRLGQLLTALGIRGVGKTVAETLATEFGALQTTLEAPEETLTAIEGIGPIIAANIQTWFASERHQTLVKKLRRAGVQLTAQSCAHGASAGPLDGKTFVITGKLSKPRQEIKAWIEERGGKVTGAISSNTDYLLVGEKRGGTKFRQAQKLNVPVIGEEKLKLQVESQRAKVES
ncbi:MAG: NAD-dependent DNA ligase LigA, partial [Anaerolineae bacterium]|nr:NAD-dependent DNA ligase LigA [Anaerolineae bacterium]